MEVNYFNRVITIQGFIYNTLTTKVVKMNGQQSIIYFKKIRRSKCQT